MQVFNKKFLIFSKKYVVSPLITLNGPQSIQKRHSDRKSGHKICFLHTK